MDKYLRRLCNNILAFRFNDENYHQRRSYFGKEIQCQPLFCSYGTIGFSVSVYDNDEHYCTVYWDAELHKLTIDEVPWEDYINTRCLSDNEDITTMHIDDFAAECGYFNGATDANNGYGCNHPEQEEYEMLYLEDGYTHRGYEDDDSKPKTKQGMCYAFSCPIAAKCYTIERLRELDAQEAESIIQENPNATEEELDDMVSLLDLMIVRK